MTISKKLKQFIKEHADCIQRNDIFGWSVLYINLEDEFNRNKVDYVTSDLTDLLLESGYEPHKHMTFLPPDYLNSSTIKQFKIPNGIERIYPRAFYQCLFLTDLSIPNSVKSIENNAFDKCVQLTEIKYDGTCDEFKKIILGKDVFDVTALKKIICTDGEINYNE